MAAQQVHLLAVALLLPAAGSAWSVGAAQRTLHEAGAIQNLHPQWQPEAVPWLSKLQAPPVLAELAALATIDNETLFRPNWDPTSIEIQTEDRSDWLALALLNKGRLQPSGCHVAPETCAVLAGLAHYLQPRPPAAAEVGVRILALQPGARLRPHHGPGGRLVAHLGIRIPQTGASLTLDGKQLAWAEGEWTVFDDSFLHSAENLAMTPRYILHVTFPHPDIVPPLPLDTAVAAAAAAAVDGSAALPIATIAAPGVSLAVFANCSAASTNTRNGEPSAAEALLLLFNRVADNMRQDWDACVNATVVPGHPDTLRIAADHGYGSVDVRITAGVRWLRFELISIADWHADPVQKHIKFASLCPVSICGSFGSGDPTAPWPGGDRGVLFPYPHPRKGASAPPGTRSEVGTFVGDFGGGYATGFLTVSSNWQLSANMWFAQPGWKLVYLIAPEAEVPQVIDEVNAAEGIAKPSKNNAYSWLWVQGLTTSANLNDTIELATSLGVQVLLLSDLTGPGMNGYITNVGDYTVNKNAWPNGLGEIQERLTPHGLKVGYHFLSSGSGVCMDQMQGPAAPGAPDGPWPSYPTRLGRHCRGDIMMDTLVSRTRPELFIPQGISPRDFHYAITAGSWPCHEQHGGGCGDITRRGGSPTDGGIVPLTPAQKARTCEARQPPCMPSNPILLVNTSTGGIASWSKVGVFRNGGAIAFSGAGAHARLRHTDEYDFRNNSFFWNITSEFTVQLTVHPSASTVGRVQVLVSKTGEWTLQISATGQLQWRVHLASGWAQAQSDRVLVNGSSYVIKATHTGSLATGRGTLKLFSCKLLAPTSYDCPLSVAEDTATGQLPLQMGAADIIWGAAELSRSHEPARGHDQEGHREEDARDETATDAATSFVGAMEELFLSRISLENITAHLFVANAYPMYLWDYTKPATRTYWADGVAAIYNEGNAVCSQWDGSEYQPGIAGWGLPHSSQTWSAGADALWWVTLSAAAEESRRQWKGDVAVEFSIFEYGDGPWRGDMQPFGDEGLISGDILMIL
jgi:hypothetical protein